MSPQLKFVLVWLAIVLASCAALYLLFKGLMWLWVEWGVE